MRPVLFLPHNNEIYVTLQPDQETFNIYIGNIGLRACTTTT